MAVSSRHSDRTADRPRREEAVGAAVALDLAEHRLDRALAFEVELFAAVAGQDAAGEVIEAAAASGARFFAPVSVAGGGSKCCATFPLGSHAHVSRNAFVCPLICSQQVASTVVAKKRVSENDGLNARNDPMVAACARRITLGVLLVPLAVAILASARRPHRVYSRA